MGVEKLDNSVYLIRGLYDLADMARSEGDGSDVRLGERTSPVGSTSGSRAPGGCPRSPTAQYADSIDDPPVGGPNNQQQDKHWIGVTPMEAELTRRRRGGAGPGDLRPRQRGARAARDRLLQRRAALQPRPVPHRLRRRLQRPGRADHLRPQHRDPGRRRGQLRPPRRRAAAALHRRRGRADVRRALHRRHAGRAAGCAAGDPAVAGLRRPGPNDANIDRCWSCRAMFMQAWGHYGTAWPVVHQQLGVRPDLGREQPRGRPAGAVVVADRGRATSASAAARSTCRPVAPATATAPTVDTGERNGASPSCRSGTRCRAGRRCGP